ncbi:MAG: prepilin-type N-terminal cleavage/methylation domain-containing protein [Candidatus Berkelbacteria bacterium]|nr:prepilin-type N-terminal cleavage/methylation domain-containing protein [Candidatus Berkelbacteria bacterium]
MMFSKSKKSFTLVELLIVISIIGIISSIVFVSYSANQKRARDAKRLADMTTIIHALKAYKQENGHYPEESKPAGDGWEYSYIATNDFLAALHQYLPAVPTDPINKVTSTFSLASRAGSYTYAYHYYNQPTELLNYDCQNVGSYAIIAFTSAEVDSNKLTEDATCGLGTAKSYDWGKDFDYSYKLADGNSL